MSGWADGTSEKYRVGYTAWSWCLIVEVELALAEDDNDGDHVEHARRVDHCFERFRGTARTALPVTQYAMVGTIQHLRCTLLVMLKGSQDNAIN